MNSRQRFHSRTTLVIMLFLICGIAIFAAAAREDPGANALAGATLDAAGAAGNGAEAAQAAAGGDAGAAAEATGEPFWLWLLLGRLHPLIVHFPIGLLCVALLMELIEWRGRSDRLRGAIGILLWVGFASGVLAALFGWLLAAGEDYQGNTIEIHRWAGIATAFFAGIALFFHQKGRTAIYRPLLILAVLGITVTGHYGASVTHGEGYLTEVLPGNGSEGEAAGPESAFSLVSMRGDTLTEEQIQDLNLEVRTILAHSCYKCHGSDKVKGELRLDTRELFMKGGENGPVIVAGDPGKSELIRRISLPAGHDDVMPSKGKKLSDKEIDVLRFWVSKGAPWPEKEKSIYYVAPLAPRTPSLPAATAALSQPIDRLVDDYFRENGIEWKEPVDDRVYIRRVYLDVIGLLPLPDSVEAFVTDKDPDKRAALVRSLLNRDHDYTQHWLTFWNDLLRNDYSGTGYITKGRFDITGWLYRSLLDNKPYNLFVEELISPSEESSGFIKGIRWRGTVNSSQSIEMQAAQNVSQVFMGLNLKCASCHDSFISDWKLEEAYAFANIFSDTIMEVNRCDKPTGKMAGRSLLFPELGTITADAPTPERLRELAGYMTQPGNGRLYRTIVNRIWAQLMGRGIIEPVDVMDNLPWSQDLLDWLATDFVENGYDIKNLIYQILTSRTYQLPSVSVEEAADLAAKDFRFEGMVRRRLTAEQFADAVSRVFIPMYADSALMTKLLPPAVSDHLPFVRASLVKNDPFLKALGRPARETVITNRISQASLLQALELTNGEKFTKALHQGAREWQDRYPATGPLITELYRRALGRPPLAEEMTVAREALGERPSEEGIQDLVWALMLVPEFQLIY